MWLKTKAFLLYYFLFVKNFHCIEISTRLMFNKHNTSKWTWILKKQSLVSIWKFYSFYLFRAFEYVRNLQVWQYSKDKQNIIFIYEKNYSGMSRSRKNWERIGDFFENLRQISMKKIEFSKMEGPPFPSGHPWNY